jgi:prepilin-type N-terminal cleavage/methylation domain-containing protein
MYLNIKEPIKLIQKGFTLVELLIVVIILAILAAIVIPQFSSSTTDAQEAALDANLSALRSAIDIYKAQHGGKYPGAVAATGATCTVGSAGTGAINTEQAIIDQLTKFSSATGATCSGADPTTVLGPYLRKGIPADPITNIATIAVATAGVPLAPSAATGGWAYDVKTGQIVMNSNAVDSKSVAYFKR